MLPFINWIMQDYGSKLWNLLSKSKRFRAFLICVLLFGFNRSYNFIHRKKNHYPPGFDGMYITDYVFHCAFILYNCTYLYIVYIRYRFTFAWYATILSDFWKKEM